MLGRTHPGDLSGLGALRRSFFRRRDEVDCPSRTHRPRRTLVARQLERRRHAEEHRKLTYHSNGARSLDSECIQPQGSKSSRQIEAFAEHLASRIAEGELYVEDWSSVKGAEIKVCLLAVLRSWMFALSDIITATSRRYIEESRFSASDRTIARRGGFVCNQCLH